MDKLRIDKWLWAARFFKTRSLAKSAIAAGKVRVRGQRTKASKEIAIGEIIQIRKGWDEKEVIIRRILDQRKGAKVAQGLYQETERSSEQRKKEAQVRSAAGKTFVNPANKPDKRERKALEKLKKKFDL